MAWLEDAVVGDGKWTQCGHELEETPGDSGAQRSLRCCSPGGHRSLIRSKDSTFILYVSYVFQKLRHFLLKSSGVPFQSPSYAFIIYPMAPCAMV